MIEISETSRTTLMDLHPKNLAGDYVAEYMGSNLGEFKDKSTSANPVERRNFFRVLKMLLGNNIIFGKNNPQAESRLTDFLQFQYHAAINNVPPEISLDETYPYFDVVTTMGDLVTNMHSTYDPNCRIIRFGSNDQYTCSDFDASTGNMSEAKLHDETGTKFISKLIGLCDEEYKLMNASRRMLNTDSLLMRLGFVTPEGRFLQNELNDFRNLFFNGFKDLELEDEKIFLVKHIIERLSIRSNRGDIALLDNGITPDNLDRLPTASALAKDLGKKEQKKIDADSVVNLLTEYEGGVRCLGTINGEVNPPRYYLNFPGQICLDCYIKSFCRQRSQRSSLTLEDRIDNILGWMSQSLLSEETIQFYRLK